MGWSKLNRRQRAFADGVKEHRDVTRAYCEAYGFPLDISGRPRKEIARRAAALLSRPDVRAHAAGRALAVSAPGCVSGPAGAAVGNEALFALKAVRAGDLALMSDPALGQLEVLARAVGDMATAELDGRRGNVPRAAVERLPVERQPPAMVRWATEHASALLELVRENHTAPCAIDYPTLRRTYEAMCADRGWDAVPWPRVSRSWRRITRTRRRYVNATSGKLLMFDVPAAVATEKRDVH